MDDGKQFAERYLNNDLSYNEYIDFLYDIQTDRGYEDTNLPLSQENESEMAISFSQTLADFYAKLGNISSPTVKRGEVPSYNYENKEITYGNMALEARSAYAWLPHDYIHETEHHCQNIPLEEFESKYKNIKHPLFSPKLNEMTEGFKTELSLILDGYLISKYGMQSDKRNILTYSCFHEVEARLKEKDVINKSLSIILNDKNTLNQKLMLLQQYKKDITAINDFFLNDSIESTLDLINKECIVSNIAYLKRHTALINCNINKKLITPETLKQFLTEGALKVNKMVEETLRQIDSVIDECKNIQDKFAEQYKEYKDVAEIISISATSYDFINKNLAEIRNRVSYLNENYNPDIFNCLPLDIYSLTFKLSEMYRQFDTDKREDALSIKKDIREFFVKFIKSQHLSFFIDNKVNDFVYGEFITKELNHLPISDIEKENIRNKVFRIKTANNFISDEQKRIKSQKLRIKLQGARLKENSVFSMPIGDAVLNDEEVIIKEETDNENREMKNVKEVEEWEER